MKVGDLVGARFDLFDSKAIVSKDDIGIIAKKTRVGQSSVYWVVKFSKSMYQTYFAWSELEVVNESR